MPLTRPDPARQAPASNTDAHKLPTYQVQINLLPTHISRSVSPLLVNAAMGRQKPRIPSVQQTDRVVLRRRGTSTTTALASQLPGRRHKCGCDWEVGGGVWRKTYGEKCRGKMGIPGTRGIIAGGGIRPGGRFGKCSTPVGRGPIAAAAIASVEQFGHVLSWVPPPKSSRKVPKTLG